MYLVSVEQMKSLEKLADETGLTYAQMMENAGTGLAQVIESEFGDFKEEYSIVGLAGSGNNGGDTLIALQKLASIGWQVQALVYKRSVKTDPFCQVLTADGGKVNHLTNESITEAVKGQIILLDGLIGTGFTPPFRDELKAYLRHLNTRIEENTDSTITVAVDCPSGMDCEDGNFDPDGIPADMTVCMAAVKRGQLVPLAWQRCGEVVVVPIGLEEIMPQWSDNLPVVLTPEIVSNMLPPRKIDGHKGVFGTAMVVGGSINYTGAPLLAGQAAARSGAGLVQMCIPARLHPILAGHFPDAVWLLLPDDNGCITRGAGRLIEKQFEKAIAMLIGPGIGQDSETARFFENLLKRTDSSAEPMGFTSGRTQQKNQDNLSIPLVIDADGLKLLAAVKDWWKLLPVDTILTPHPGEMSILTGLDVKEIQEQRLEIAAESAQKWNCMVVLKGAGTVIASPDGKTAILPIATSALAHAGSGDVLAGIILGLRAQGMDAYFAACAGVWAHAEAGQIAAEEEGHTASLLASDISAYLGLAFNQVWDTDR